MTPLIVLEAGACPLPLDNVDTDQLIPARFMKRPRSDGYGQFLLHDLRQDATNPACALDQDRFKDCQIMIAGRNFGCGSSREAAVYALADFGFRCVIASSFGDIFASNAVKNGILPALVSPEHIKILLAHQIVTRGEPIRIDLADQHIRIGTVADAELPGPSHFGGDYPQHGTAAIERVDLIGLPVLHVKGVRNDTCSRLQVQYFRLQPGVDAGQKVHGDD